MRHRIATTLLCCLLAPCLWPAHAQVLSPSLIPQPQRLQSGEGAFTLDRAACVVAPEHQRGREIAEFLRAAVAADHGLAIAMQSACARPIELRLDSTIAGDEAYRLTVTPQRITLAASQPRGWFWAAQTLRQLLPPGRAQMLQVPALQIDDAPRFGYRGHMLDVGRHFMPVEFIKKQIDLLSFYKLNTFRWHLTEDQGWRIEIKKYPKLTQVGAWRSEADGTRYGGYYTQQQIREVVEYARRRNVMVIPEIEMPGHSSAALAAYPELSCRKQPVAVPNGWGVFKDVLCVGEERAFDFVTNVLDEVIALFPAPYVHIGGDEVPKDRWRESAATQQRMRTEGLRDEHALQSWFIRRVQRYLAGKGRSMIGWDEILEGGADRDAIVEVWRGETEGAKALANGNRIISAGPFYLDSPLQTLTLEKVYNTDVLPPAYAGHAAQVLGAEAPLWTERVTPRNAEAMLYPRLLAFAEITWSAPQPRDFAGFKTRLADHYRRLDAWQVGYGPEDRALVEYRIAREGDGWRLQAQRGFDDLRNRYRRDGTAPGADSPAFTDALTLREPGVVSVAPFRGARAYLEPRTYTLAAHRALDKPLQWSVPPNRQYRQGGDGMLVDGLFGGDSHADGLWAGWQGQDLQLTIDLQQATPLRSISTRFLQQSGSWILLPKAVRYYASADGRDWRLLQANDLAVDPDDAQRRVLDVRFDAAQPLSTRYLRMDVTRYGALPAGHAGAGSEAFFFLDEVVVE